MDRTLERNPRRAGMMPDTASLSPFNFTLRLHSASGLSLNLLAQTFREEITVCIHLPCVGHPLPSSLRFGICTISTSHFTFFPLLLREYVYRDGWWMADEKSQHGERRGNYALAVREESFFVCTIFVGISGTRDQSFSLIIILISPPFLSFRRPTC